MISVTELEKRGRQFEYRRPVDDPLDWETGQVVEFMSKRGQERLRFRVVGWGVSMDGDDQYEWRGHEEWVYVLERSEVRAQPRLLTPAASPGWSEKGYTALSYKAMGGTADPGEAVEDEYQERISAFGWQATDERLGMEQRVREQKPWHERIEAVKQKAREKGAGRLTRAEIRTVEVMGRTDRRRARKAMKKLEVRLFR